MFVRAQSDLLLASAQEEPEKLLHPSPFHEAYISKVLSLVPPWSDLDRDPLFVAKVMLGNWCLEERCAYIHPFYYWTVFVPRR